MTKFVVTDAKDAPDNEHTVPFYSDDESKCYFPVANKDVFNYEISFDSLSELNAYIHVNGWSEPLVKESI
jgi:hypothetical protein